MTETYFFDTYAVLEVIEGNQNYLKYTACGMLLTKLNLFEIFYAILREKGAENAKSYLNKYKDSAVEFGSDVIESAAILKRSNAKLSMADCIGYVAAIKEGVRFLTGDKEFERMANVEFVK